MRLVGDAPRSRLIPVAESYDGENFFTRGADGVRMATPLLLALAVVEISDVVFAVDSIPAVSCSLRFYPVFSLSGLPCLGCLPRAHAFTPGCLRPSSYPAPHLLDCLGALKAPCRHMPVF